MAKDGTNRGGRRVLRWMMDNIFIRTDPAGNIKPDKKLLIKTANVWLSLATPMTCAEYPVSEKLLNIW